MVVLYDIYGYYARYLWFGEGVQYLDVVTLYDIYGYDARCLWFGEGVQYLDVVTLYDKMSIVCRRGAIHRCD